MMFLNVMMFSIRAGWTSKRRATCIELQGSVWESSSFASRACISSGSNHILYLSFCSLSYNIIITDSFCDA